MLGIVPAFNVSNFQNATPFSPGRKFHLAFRGATDPFIFLVAGVDSGLNQWQNNFAGYGLGAEGYAKRFGASYGDNFINSMLGNAAFPILLHQDPRYFRKGTGSFGSRLLYVSLSAVRTRGDNGKWQPNYSSILGNFAAGGIANLYYPEADRGASLTAKRALTVSLGSLVAAFGYEFWPDVSRKMQRKHKP